MSHATEAPRGAASEGRAAGPNGRASRSFPTREYHRGAQGARPELLQVRTPQGMKVAGAFVQRDGGEVFEKLVQVEAHMLKHPCDAWAVDCRALEEASRRGVRLVVMHDRRVGTWWASVRDFEEHGVPIDRGWGAQVALGLGWFSFVPLSSVTPQLALFAEVGR